MHRKITDGMKASRVKEIDLTTSSEVRIVMGTESISTQSMNDADYRVVAKCVWIIIPLHNSGTMNMLLVIVP